MVKLISVRLVNFKKFYSGMNKKEVYVNLEHCPFKTIMIEGPNGVGKSSLLEELNPLPGVKNTYTIIKGETGVKTVTFVANDNKVYQVQYTYVPNKDTHLCKGNLYVIVNGSKKSIIQNSSVTETISKVKELTGYDNKLHKLAAIGIGADERGIVYMSSSERRAYLQAIGPLGDIRERVKIISDKYIYTKKSKESIENRLGKLESADSLIISKRNLDNEKESLNKELDNSKYRNIRSTTELESMSCKLTEYATNSEDLGKIIEFIRENNIEGTVNDYNEQLQRTIGEKKGMLMSLQDRYVSVSSKLSLCDMHKDRNINDVKSELEAHEFNKYKDGSTPYVTSRDALSMLKSIYDNFSRQYRDMLYHLPEGVNIQAIIDKPSVDVNSVREKISHCIDAIQDLDKLKETNYVPDGWQVERSSTCKDDDCPLYQKFLSIYDKVDKYKDAVNKLSEAKEQFNDLNYDLNISEAKDATIKDLELICNLIDGTDALSILDETVFKDSKAFKEALKNRHIFNYDDTLKDISYVSSLAITYQNILDEYDNLKSNDVDNLKIEMSNIEKDIETIKHDIQELEVTVSKSIRNNRYASFSIAEAKSMMSTIQNERYDLSIEYKQAVTLKNEYDTYQKNNANSIQRVSEIDKELIEISNKLYLRNALEEELQTNITDYADITKIKETLTKHLPNKVMNKIMLNLKDVTNEFLETTDLEYRVHSFEVTSKEFIIRIQNGSTISSDVRNMSQGEISIMTLATTLALNKIFLPNYSIMTMDEIDATLSEENRRKFLNILEAYRSFKDLQLFVVSHNRYYNATSDVGVISLRGTDTELKVKALVESDL